VLEVAQQFDTQQLPIQRLKLVAQGVDVIESDVSSPVQFQVLVTPDPAAGAAGCLALPSSFTVEARTAVIFEATVGVGYAFVGWFIGGILQTADLIASVVIPAPQVSGQILQVEARFQVSP
jgi:hypothetical protein